MESPCRGCADARLTRHQSLQRLPSRKIDRRRAAREEGGADGGFPTSLLSYWPGFIFSIYCVSLLLRKERKSMSKQHQLRPWYIDAHTPVILSSPRTDGRRAARWRGGVDGDSPITLLRY